LPFILATAALLTAIGGCSDSTSPPPEKDPRTYTWSLDTIYNPRTLQTLLQDVWGTSALNIYAVGHSSNYEGKMYHFDGFSWNRVPLHTSEGGTVYGLSELSCIRGFGGNAIFAAGTKYQNGIPVGVLVSYDGSIWREVQIDSVGPLQSIWGASLDDIWVGGFHTLLRRQGPLWQKVDFPARTDQVQFIRITGTSSSNVCLIGVSIGPSDPYVYDQRMDLYHYDGNTLSIVDSLFEGLGHPRPHFGPNLKFVSGSLYSGGAGLFRLEGQEWIQILDSPDAIHRIGGRRSTRLFAVGSRGLILYYDGIGGYKYPQNLPTVSLSSVWEYDLGVVAVGYDGMRSYVLHGR